MLIQLPNGHWINPVDVQSVKPHTEFIPDQERRLHHYVQVKLSNGDTSWCEVDTVVEVGPLRDQIAEQVNRALYKPTAGLS